MTYYCGIDLHSNNHVVVVIDDEDKRVYEKRLGNDLNLTLEALSPYQSSLQGIAVESIFNWYWLVDEGDISPPSSRRLYPFGSPGWVNRLSDCPARN